MYHVHTAPQAVTHLIFCRLFRSGFKLENFCPNFHTVIMKKKTLIWRAGM